MGEHCYSHDRRQFRLYSRDLGSLISAYQNLKGGETYLWRATRHLALARGMDGNSHPVAKQLGPNTRSDCSL